MHHPTDRITHTTAFVKPVILLLWLIIIVIRKEIQLCDITGWGCLQGSSWCISSLYRLYGHQVEEASRLNIQLGVGIGLFQGLANLALNGKPLNFT